MAAAAGIGLLTWILAGWAVGVVVASLTALALLTRRGGIVLRVVGIGSFAASAGYVLFTQWRERLVADFYWMNQFEITHAWTLAAVALLVVDAVVVGLRRRRAG